MQPCLYFRRDLTPPVEIPPNTAHLSQNSSEWLTDVDPIFIDLNVNNGWVYRHNLHAVGSTTDNSNTTFLLFPLLISVKFCVHTSTKCRNIYVHLCTIYWLGGKLSPSISEPTDTPPSKFTGPSYFKVWLEVINFFGWQNEWIKHTWQGVEEIWEVGERYGINLISSLLNTLDWMGPKCIHSRWFTDCYNTIL